jgi:hypothetical protein
MAKKTGKRIDPREGTVKQCIDDAIAEFECLKVDMEDWRDSLDANNMGHLPKYDEVCECVDNLDSAMNVIEEILTDGLPAEVNDLPVSYHVDTRRRKKSRNDAFGEALSIFERAVGVMRKWAKDKDEFLKEIPPKESEKEEYATMKNRVALVEAAVDEFKSAIDYFSSVSFPGMYG